MDALQRLFERVADGLSVVRILVACVAITILITVLALAWCMITRTSPGPAGDLLVEVIRILVGALPR
jgi:hypothetical protein